MVALDPDDRTGGPTVAQALSSSPASPTTAPARHFPIDDRATPANQTSMRVALLARRV
jgi:hypothetical protein